MHFLGLLSALTVVLTVGCMDEDEWLFALEKAYIDFNEARVSRNATLVAEFFSNDAKILGDGKDVVAGRAAVESMLTRHFAGDMRIVLKLERLIVWNDLGAVVEDSAVTLNPEHVDRVLEHTQGVRVFVWEDDQPKISMSIFDPKVGSE